MTFAEFYKEIKEVYKDKTNIEKYKIYTEYTERHKQVLSLINELEDGSTGKYDNLRYRYLPKPINTGEVVAYANITSSVRFINENDKYPEAVKGLSDNCYIGYWTVQKRVSLYTSNNQSLGQFGLPKKGLFIPQSETIIVNEKSSVRQQRGDTKYKNMLMKRKIEIDDEFLPKEVWCVSSEEK